MLRKWCPNRNIEPALENAIDVLAEIRSPSNDARRIIDVPRNRKTNRLWLRFRSSHRLPNRPG
jgi:hypothetical protein